MLTILIISLLLACFFSGFEIAFSNANRLSIELKKKQGTPSGVILSHFLDNSSRLYAALLLAFNTFLVIYCLAAIAFLSTAWKVSGIMGIDKVGLLQLLLDFILAGVLFIIIEFLIRALFRAKADFFLDFFAGFANFFYTIFNSISLQCIKLSNWILKYIFNIQVDEQKNAFGRIVPENYFQQSNFEEEDNSDDLNELFENALSLPGIKVRSCLVPRKEIVAIELSTPVPTAVAKLTETMLSKLVVYEENIDNILGYVHQLDMFKSPPNLQSILLPIPAVPETMSVTDLISRFSKERKSIAWVVDEFGGTSGIVTMEDLLEEIFGEIKDEYDTDELVDKQLSENEYMFSGRMELDTLTEKYNFTFDIKSAGTLSGYIVEKNENLPKQGEKIITGNYQFDIINMSDTRIELIKLKVLK